VKATTIQEGLYTHREISANYRLMWRILKDKGEIEVVAVVKGTGFVGIGWRPKDAEKSCQRWPKLGSEADAEAEGEAEVEAEAEKGDFHDEMCNGGRRCVSTTKKSS
jgi:hypothetical protein